MNAVRLIRRTVALGAVAVGALLTLAVPGLWVLGFGPAGIIAGLFGASIQGPAVVAGGWFALAQSVGATATIGTVLFNALGGVSLFSFGWNLW